MSTWEPASPGYCSIHGWHGYMSCPSCTTSVPTPIPRPTVAVAIDPAAPGGVYERIADALERIAEALTRERGDE